MVGGLDIGASSIKAVILSNNEILSYSIIKSGEGGDIASRKAMEEALRKVNLSLEAIGYIVSTGRERNTTTLAKKQGSEQICNGRGGRWLFSSAMTILDLGAESCKVVKLNEKGKVKDYAQSDKCAGGTGAFLDIIAKAMEVSFEEMVELVLRAKKKSKISSFCSVFAESEVISLIHSGVPKDHILAGIHEGIADRILQILNRVGLEKDIIMVGGGAKNVALVRTLKEKTGLNILIPDEPQIVGALGAALIAQGM